MWKYNNTEIYHFGIKGMQWGKRTTHITRTTKASVNNRKIEKNRKKIEV